MRKKDVLAFYHGNQSEVARTLKITRASVNGWPVLVPPFQARRLHELTAGQLKYDPADYASKYPAHRFIPPAVEAI